MWQKPWKIKEGILIGSGLVLTGLLLQFTAGPIQWSTFAWPANVILLGLIAIGLCLSYFLFGRVYVLRYLTTYQAAVPSLLFTVALTILMGVTKQYAAPDPADFLGFHYALSNWSFVLVYLWMTLIVGLTTMRQIACFKLKRWPSVVSHLGLLMVIVCGTLGSADMLRLKMYCEQGQPEWRALDSNNKVHELPLAIQLDSFMIDEYPPRLMLVSNKTGDTERLNGKALTLSLDDGFAEGALGNYQVRLKKKIELAAPKMATDSTTYTEWKAPGATCAANIEVRPLTSSDEPRRGWVTCGSYMFPNQLLEIDSLHSLGMSQREPQRYASKIQILTKAGDNVETVVEVNKPYTICGWKVYQYSYNEQMGKWSTYSVFELVADPWLPAVYIGIVLLMSGAFGLFFTKRTK